MSERAPTQTAAEASRRNGALSRGPISLAGKATSARNARKHGLFSAEVRAGAVSLAFAAVLEHLRAQPDFNAAAAWQGEIAAVAARRLDHALGLIRDSEGELAAALLDPAGSGHDLVKLIEAFARLRGHARRFRGQRDRALRKALGLTRTAALPDPVHDLV